MKQVAGHIAAVAHKSHGSVLLGDHHVLGRTPPPAHVMI